MTLKPKKLSTLLLVTDSPLVRGFFEKVIQKVEDLTLIIVSSKLEALDYLDASDISLIIIDEKTPHLNSRELCIDIRQMKPYQHTPILMLTPHLKKPFIRSLIKAGATDFLREPLEEDEFLLRMEVAKKIMVTQAKMMSVSTRLPFRTPP